MPKEIDPQQFALDVKEWKACVEWLSRAKRREMELRVKLAEQLFTLEPNGAFPPGTQNVVRDYDPVHTLSGKLSVQYKYEVLDETLEATIGEMGKAWKPELLRVKHELSKKEFDLLDPKAKAIMQKTLVIKPQAPQLELTLEPKPTQQ